MSYPDWAPEAARLREEGHSLRAIGARLRVTHTAVFKALQALRAARGESPPRAAHNPAAMPAAAQPAVVPSPAARAVEAALERAASVPDADRAKRLRAKLNEITGKLLVHQATPADMIEVDALLEPLLDASPTPGDASPKYLPDASPTPAADASPALDEVAELEAELRRLRKHASAMYADQKWPAYNTAVRTMATLGGQLGKLRGKGEGDEDAAFRAGVKASAKRARERLLDMLGREQERLAEGLLP